MTKRVPQTQAELAAAVELNSTEWLRLHGCLPWVQLHDEPDVVWTFAGDTWPQNMVALAKFSAVNARQRIAQILGTHLEQKVSCNWIVGPASEPSDIPRHLRACGFSCRIHCAAMACEVDNIGASVVAPVGIAVELSDSPPSLTRLTTERRRKRHEGRCALGRLLPKRIWHFSATFEGVPVGETSLFEGAGVAGIYNVEVVKEHRRQGIGSALVASALRHAKKLGYHCAVLGANRMGTRVYERQGFRECGKLSFWKYGKMRQLAD